MVFGGSCLHTVLGLLSSLFSAVILDTSIQFNKQMSSAFFSCVKVKPDLPNVHHLDDCFSVFCGLQLFIHRLQLVQNALALLITGTEKREHKTPVLTSLHWLQVRYTTDFKMFYGF